PRTELNGLSHASRLLVEDLHLLEPDTKPGWARHQDPDQLGGDRVERHLVVVGRRAPRRLHLAGHVYPGRTVEGLNRIRGRLGVRAAADAERLVAVEVEL